MRRTLQLGLAIVATFAVLQPASAVKFAELESQVQEFTLDNGLKFVVLERHETPVFSFRTYVNAGGVDEVAGVTGIAHMFEHMAFKGTKSLGSTDFGAEQTALAAVDAAWAAYAAEENKGHRADAARLEELSDAFEAAKKTAQEFVVSNEFTKILEENGVQGLNASTGLDFTWYYYSLPSNRLELWARLEGDRMTNPVMREFYVERNVVIEERRFQESSPTGRLFNELLVTGFVAHPYGTGVIGFKSDLERITRSDASDFFAKYYTAENMTVVLVGDVEFEEVKKLAQRYFSGVRSGPRAPRVRTIEPEHTSQIRIEREEDTQSILAAGFYIPGRDHPSWFAYELLGDILASGRTSRLYERLVKEDQTCSQIFGGVGFPGEKYPNLLLTAGFINSDSTPAEVEAVIFEELQRIVLEGPSAEELAKVKSISKAGFIRALRSNSGIAGQLAMHEGMLGDWRELFDYVEEIEAVSVEDIQKAAEGVLKKSNSIIATIQKPEGTES